MKLFDMQKPSGVCSPLFDGTGCCYLAARPRSAGPHSAGALSSHFSGWDGHAGGMLAVSVSGPARHVQQASGGPTRVLVPSSWVEFLVPRPSCAKQER